MRRRWRAGADGGRGAAETAPWLAPLVDQDPVFDATLKTAAELADAHVAQRQPPASPRAA